MTGHRMTLHTQRRRQQQQQQQHQRQTLPCYNPSRNRRYPSSLLLPVVLVITMAITTLTSAFVLPPTTIAGVHRHRTTGPHSTRTMTGGGGRRPPPPLTMALSEFELTTPDIDVMDLQEGQRLVCIGDVHGDVRALRDMLHLAGLLHLDDGNDKQDNSSHDKEDDNSSSNSSRDTTADDDQDLGKIRWTGGNTILVQTGDILDRGDSELACWRLLAGLSEQANEAGGAVIVLWGNHEAMNCMGQFHYTTGEFEYRQLIESLMGNAYDERDEVENMRYNPSFIPPRHQPARESVYEPGTGLLVQPLLGKLKVAVKVGRTLCVHAGLTSRHLDAGGLAGLNRQAREWVQDGGNLPECLVGSDGPVWMREYSHPGNVEPTSAAASQRLAAALFCAGADRMVVGHTVQTEGINSALDGKIWRIDTGASRGVANGRPECLEIVKEQGREIVSVLTADGGKVSGTERRARSPVLVERVVQAVADNVAIPIAEAIVGN